MGDRIRTNALVTGLAALALLVAAGCTLDADATDRGTTGSTDAETSTDPDAAVGADGLPEGRDVVVTSITDGDTFRAGDERIRLIGVDTPEVSFGVECYGNEATDALEAMIPPGTTVRLVRDVSDTDRYDRTLAYVYRADDGLDVNLALVDGGYATPLTVPPDVARADEFVAASAAAREASRGLWSACSAAG